MYFPLGFPDVARATAALSSEQDLLQVAHSTDGSLLLCTITKSSISLWRACPLVHLSEVTRSAVSVHDLGKNLFVRWREDGASVVVATDKGQLLFYVIKEDPITKACQLRCRPGHESRLGFAGQLIPATQVLPGRSSGPANTATIMHNVTAVVLKAEEVIVATTAGVLERVPWDEGFFDATAAIVLSRVQFPQREPGILPGVHAIHMHYCSVTNVLALTLSDGTAACLSSSTSDFEGRIQGSWVPAVPSRPFRRISSAQEAKSKLVAVNARYRLVAVGCDNGDVHVYNIDEHSELTYSHSLWCSPHEANASASRLQHGTLSHIEWSPDGCALALSMSRTGGISLWSVFGCRLTSIIDQADRHVIPGIRSFAWGPEGYFIFALSTELAQRCDGKPAEATSTTDADAAESAEEPPAKANAELLRFHFVKSSLTVTSSSCGNQSNVVLQGSDRLCLNPSRSEEPSNTTIGKLCDLQWQSLELPTNYITEHWPIKMVATSEDGQYLAMAGPAGFAHYNVNSRKWRLFGNQTHERELLCHGLAWWRDYIFVACYNLGNETHELRCYNRNDNLDNRNVLFVYPLQRRIRCMSVHQSNLVLCTASRKARVYALTLRSGSSADQPAPRLTLVWEMQLKDHIPNIENLVSLTLVSGGNDQTDQADQPDQPSGLIANVAGRLLMFALDLSGERDLNFAAPVLLATGVENYWTPSKDQVPERHLQDALWLGCGGAGMKVWLPLYHEDDDQPSAEHTAPSAAVAKRIMLPFHLNICPLAVMFQEGIVLGASSEPHFSSSKTPLQFPLCSMERQTQLFLHLILRQMLRRNLDVHAKKICAACCSLEYFPHVLELLLHEVLEEEADERQMIVREDALLPRVVQFLSRYPNWLDILVQCARKTEVAKWPYLFSIAGNVRDLFETCVSSFMYSTAASFLMVMQSLESAVESRKQALRLLNIALWEERWDLTRDLIRFLEATTDTTESARASPVAKILDGPREGISEQLLGSHARKLLGNGQLSLLGRFAESLQFPLIEWLAENRFEAGCSIDDFGRVLAAVHAAYSWPIPEQTVEDVPVDGTVYDLQSASGAATPAQQDSEPCTPKTSRESSRDTLPLKELNSGDKVDLVAARLELEYLLNVFFEARCYDWTFVIAVMLQDQWAVSQVLEEIAADQACEDGIFGLLTRAKPAMDVEPGKAYREFFNQIENTVRRATPVQSDLERERPSAHAAPAAANSDCIIS